MGGVGVGRTRGVRMLQIGMLHPVLPRVTHSGCSAPCTSPRVPLQLYCLTCRVYCPQGTPVKVYRPCESVVTEHRAVVLRAASILAMETCPGGWVVLQPAATSSSADNRVTCGSDQSAVQWQYKHPTVIEVG